MLVLRMSGLVAALMSLISLAEGEDLEGRKHFSERLFEATFAIQADTCCLGTGFCIGCQSNRRVLFLTARHVLDSLPGDTATIIYRKRLSDTTWQAFGFRQCIRRHGKPLYAVHPDSHVDIAAFWIEDPGDSLFLKQFAPFDRGVLAKDEDIRKYWLHPGDELFFIGYPVGTASPQGVFPILRSGFVSSYPLLPLRKNPFIYLDGSVFDGNSGGPVYFEYHASSWNKRSVNQKGMIIGLISHALSPEVPLKIDPVKKKRDIRIGGFVNSEFILELLDSLECR